MNGLAPLVVVNGYYGFDNYGDELLLGVLCEQLHQRGARVLVLSANPDDTCQRHGVDAIGRYDLPAIWQALRAASVFVSGGGGLFQDSTGPNSVLYYGGLIVLARLLGRPVAHIFQSVGPLQTAWGRWMTRQALRLSQLIAVRDERSADAVAHLTGQRPLVTADLGWLSQPHIEPADWDPAWRVGISLRPHGDLTHERLKALATTLAELTANSQRSVRFLLIPCQWAEDEEPLRVLESYLQEAVRSAAHPSTVIDWVNPEDDTITQALGSCHLLLGMRFHSVVMGVRCGTPVFGLVYDPKVSALLASLGLQGCTIDELDRLTADQLRDYFAQYPAVDQAPLQDKVTVALNAVQALYL